MKKTTVAKQESKGRPATGQTPMLGFRAADELRGRIVHWAQFQADAPKLSEAVRRLVELGLTVKMPRSKNVAQRARASDMAARAIDKMTDKGASADDQASRKRRLLKGPAEFRDVRVDRKAKK
ncbi:hypothetical protein [Bradyrhizobium sp. NFR13]|uniref:hypothetical protein n=1 Tax=Bradyrhizobium sp. NFR13 TaxID=1566285 RepID=UPI00111464E6|nr:hypothetical protein [Bradyrhizobium sp. NFR13]